MSEVEKYEILVLGSGGAGKFLAWTMAKAGHRTAMVERKWLGGSYPTVACLSSKNLINAAKVAALAKRGAEFGLEMDSLAFSMAGVQRRKRMMVEGLHQMHVDHQAASGAELIMGDTRFVAPRTAEVALNDSGTRTLAADCVFLALDSRATMPDVPGLAAAQPMTHVAALDLDRLPPQLTVLGGGYVGLELSQAMRRFGSQVTVIEAGPQLAGREDPDVGEPLLELFHDEGIGVLLETHVSRVEGHSSQTGLVPEVLQQIRVGQSTGDAKRDALVRFGRNLAEGSGMLSDEEYSAIKVAGDTAQPLEEINLAIAVTVFTNVFTIGLPAVAETAANWWARSGEE
jgi:pyruvate/2-oxoglutarate dehydrogenase complex dihydrolipoamide dehydrogenase (E3) component